MISTNTIKWWEWVLLFFCRPVVHVAEKNYGKGNDYGSRLTVKYFRGKCYIVKIEYF